MSEVTTGSRGYKQVRVKMINYPAHTCASRSHVIGAGPFILYVHVYDHKKKFEWHFSGRLSLNL